MKNLILFMLLFFISISFATSTKKVEVANKKDEIWIDNNQDIFN